ncbi:MAG TPA: TetR/AcrR family transcriptional regulator [Nocardioidaceae bacterium]|nr:TetR/AcrR family transcriptional regulator [Nocardioidaceae bacterium]
MADQPSTARALNRKELTRAILEQGRAQLAAVGPGELSLRAVARDLGMASSAVYRYFPSRDHLITALLIECYDESGAAVEAADDGVPKQRYRKRWLAMSGALRAWAKQNFFEYALLYGSPVPGYAAPQDTIGPAQRVPFRLLGLMADVEAAGITMAPHQSRLSRAARSSFAPIGEIVPGIGDERMVGALTAWATLLGAITLELFGHLEQGVLDHDAHFSAMMDRIADDLGLP